MSDYGESGAQPIEDAAVEDPPTVDEVAAEQKRLYGDTTGEEMVHPTTTDDADPD